MNNITGYEILKQLSKDRPGNRYAKVYQAKQLDTGAMVTIKTAQKSADSAKIVARIQHEAEFNFDEEGLPKVLEVIETDSSISLVKQYVEGESILSFTSNLSYNEKLFFLKQVVHELTPIMQYMQAAGIVHCDIQPENLLVRFEDNVLKVSIIDFGLAFDRSRDGHDRPLHFQLSYSAPELILNVLPLINARVDIYAFGLTIYSLITGELPFRHANPSIATNLALTYPLERSPKIPKDWWAVIEKATYKKPFPTAPNKMGELELSAHLKEAQGRRYSSFKEFAEDVSHLTERAGVFTRLGLF